MKLAARVLIFLGGVLLLSGCVSSNFVSDSTGSESWPQDLAWRRFKAVCIENFGDLTALRSAASHHGVSVSEEEFLKRDLYKEESEYWFDEAHQIVIAINTDGSCGVLFNNYYRDTARQLALLDGYQVLSGMELRFKTPGLDHYSAAMGKEGAVSITYIQSDRRGTNKQTRLLIPAAPRSFYDETNEFLN